ncbi:MAG: glycosyltransferase family 9 protein [Deltaproteobacteria bacterium]|nr:glycosyltransferase family 9 protein [Deltaproteobacteria bacterium]
MALPVEPKKILFVLHGSLGDITRALPLAQLVRRRFPRAFLAWSVEPACFPLLENFAAIDEVIIYDRHRPIAALWPFLRQIHARRFDLVLDLQRHFKSGVVSRASGAPCRLGFHPSDAKEGNGFFNNYHIDAVGDSVAKIDHYMKFAEWLGIAPRPIEWQIELTPQDKLAVRRHLSGVDTTFAALFVGSRWPSKDWFAEQIAGCANALLRHHGLSVVLLGGGSEAAVAEQVVRAAEGRVVNLVGQTSLREAVGVIQHASVCIGPDTGLMHLAAAVGTPVISLWGATDPKRTGPYGFGELVIQGKADCAPCYRKNCTIGKICMRSISSDAIVNKVAAVLRRSVGQKAAHGHWQ